MSWEVGDDELLSEPTASPAAGPVDPLDAHMIEALSPVGFRGTAPADAQELTIESLPPPPYSAAFDEADGGDTPSYESGSFVAEPAEEELEFHIPALAIGVTVESPANGSHAEEPAAEGLVIPTLSASAEPAVEADEVDEVDETLEEVEVDELEEVHEIAVRTGDTVIARAPTAPEGEPHVEVSQPDEATLVIPELVERIDTAELELEAELHEEDAVEASVDDEPPVEPVGFVIPTLARAEPESSVYDDDPEDDEPEDDDALEDDDEPVLGITASELVLPLLAAGRITEAEASDDDAAQQAPEDDVDPESIESLDAADLEELEQPVAVAVAVEPVEPRPPAPPPEAKGPAKRRKAWYDDVFAEHFLFLYPLTWDETCQRDAQFIFSQLGGREGLSVLDVGCGDGIHAVELAKLGARVTGIDNSLALLLSAAQNKESAALDDGRVEFIHGDMRRLPRDREFDAVMCVGTTLGYFEEEQNWLCLQEMHDRLRPGGRLLIHVFNRDFVAPHLPSRSWWQGKRCMVIDEAEMNFFANRLRVHRTIIFDDGRQYEHYMFMRAYTVQDLGKAISQLGMRVLEVSGSRDTPGRFYGSASPDVWIVAEKK